MVCLNDKCTDNKISCHSGKLNVNIHNQSICFWVLYLSGSQPFNLKRLKIFEKNLKPSHPYQVAFPKIKKKTTNWCQPDLRKWVRPRTFRHLFHIMSVYEMCNLSTHTHEWNADFNINGIFTFPEDNFNFFCPNSG